MLLQTIYLCTSVGLRNMFHELSPSQCRKYDSQAIIKNGKKNDHRTVGHGGWQ